MNFLFFSVKRLFRSGGSGDQKQARNKSSLVVHSSGDRSELKSAIRNDKPFSFHNTEIWLSFKQVCQIHVMEELPHYRKDETSLCFSLNACKLIQVCFKATWRVYWWVPKPTANPHSVPAVQGVLLICWLPFYLWISSVALSSGELEIPERLMRPIVVLMPPSVNHRQLFWATAVRTSSPPLLFSNFVPDYLDQWALKDPGKDKHSSLRGWEKGVYFQTEQKSL